MLPALSADLDGEVCEGPLTSESRALVLKLTLRPRIGAPTFGLADVLEAIGRSDIH